MAFAPEGSTLILGGEKAITTFWTVTPVGATYAGQVTYEGDFLAVTAIGVDPGGRLLAVAAGSTVGLFDITDVQHPHLVGRLDDIAHVQTVATVGTAIPP